jgi:elongator complex protein 1
MKNLILLQERRHIASQVQDICFINDSIQEYTVVLTKEGNLIAPSWRQKIEEGDKWFSIIHVDPHIVCLSKDGDIVSIHLDNFEQEVVGKFDNGILAAKWSPDCEVLALVTLSNIEDKGKCAVLMTMSADFEVLGEVTLENFDENSPVSISWRPDATHIALNTLETIDNTRRIRTYDRESLCLQSVGRSEDGSGKVVPNLHHPLSWASPGCSNLIASVQRKTKKTQQVVFFEPNGLRHREFILRSQCRVQCLFWNSKSDVLAVVSEEDDGSSHIQLWHRSNYHWYLKYELQFESSIFCSKFHDESPYKLYVCLNEGWREYTFCWDVSTYTFNESGFTAYSIDGATLKSTPIEKALIPPPMYMHSVTFEACIRQVLFHRGMVFAYLSNGCLGYFDKELAPTMLTWETKELVDIHGLRHLTVVKSNDSIFEMVAVDSNDRLIVMEVEIASLTVKLSHSINMEGSIFRIVKWADYTEGSLIELDDGQLLEYNDGTVVPSLVESLLEPCPWIEGLFHPEDLNVGEGQTERDRLVIGLSSRSRLYCHDRLLANSVSSFQVSMTHRFLCYTTAETPFQLRSLALSFLHNFDPLMGSDEQNLDGYEPRNIERGARLVAICQKQPTAILQMPRGNLEGIYPRSLMLPFVMSKIISGEYGVAFSMMRRHKIDLNLLVDIDYEKFLSVGVLTLIEEIPDIDYLNLFVSTLHNSNVLRGRYQLPELNILKSFEPSGFDEANKVNTVCNRFRFVLLDAEERGCTQGGHPVTDGYYLLPILSTYAKEFPPKLEEALCMIRDKAIKQHDQINKKNPMFSDKAQKAIQYLAFLADYKLLYETALGMYDFNLARAIARNSQMDPKVYLPFLKRLNCLPQNFAMYEVDLRLKQYESALLNLHASAVHAEDLSQFFAPDGSVLSNTFEKCLEFIEQHSLHRSGLHLYKEDSHKYNILLKSLGDNLMQKGDAKSALAVFLSSDPVDLNNAKEASRKCGDWRFYFSLCNKSESENIDDNDFRLSRIAHEIANEIVGGKGSLSRRESYLDAARILIDYGADIIGAVDLLNLGEMWSEARRLAILHGRTDLVKRIVDAASSYAEGIITDCFEKQDHFTSTSARYIEVLKIRREAMAGMLESGEAMDHLEEDDTGSQFSITSSSTLRSTASSGSASSFRSVSSVSTVISVGQKSTFTMTLEHNRERHKSKFNSTGKKEKKKAKRKGPKKNKLRPGSEEELSFLVSSLKNCCVDATYAAVIEETAFFLVQVGQMELSRRLVNSYESLRTAVETCQKERMISDTQEKFEMQQKVRMEGGKAVNVTLPCEEVVNSLECAVLSTTLTDLFSYL